MQTVKKKNLRAKSSAITEGPHRAPNRAMLRGVGLKDEDFEKPLIVFAIDNSASMKLSNDSISLSGLMLDLKQLESNLEDAGFETRSRTLDLANSEEEIQFEHQETDLSALMKGIANDFQGFNLSSVVLFSDGIYNTGISPTYSSYTYPVNTIGAGDTTRNKCRGAIYGAL